MHHERKLRLFIYARIFVTFLFLVSTITLNRYEPEAIYELSNTGMVRLMAFSFLFSIFSHFLLKFQGYRQFITYLQTIWDLLFVTVLLLFTGGVSSPYSFLYLLSIMNAGVLLGRREAFYTASLCGILYGAIVDLQYFGYLRPLGLSHIPALQLGATHLFYNIFLNMMGFYLTSVITGYLSEMAKSSEDELHRKSVNYLELERLSTSIVSNIESGLMTITPQGNIRVFNRYAEELTGKKQLEVYDSHLSILFPQLSEQLSNDQEVKSGEFNSVDISGMPIIISYSIVPFSDMHGQPAGQIVNFKDISSIRRLEVALKQKDRLAALGGLSARMAHEIRNPLASMSGAVQLLVEHGSVKQNDQRLLTIILREADRLNSLITEFLAYARPASPSREKFSLHLLVEEMLILLESDHKFDTVKIHNHVPVHMNLFADANQIRQVLLNLVHNAAEASPFGGDVVISGSFQLNGADGFHNSPAAVITVTDNGTGIDKQTAVHLFEPFWTTKSEGTGLGLAVVYRIIEGHGGVIQLESLPDKGCCAKIWLPV